MKVPNGGAWTTIVTDGIYTTARMGTIGGWLVRLVSTDQEDQSAILFVHDPTWEWELSTTDDS